MKKPSTNKALAIINCARCGKRHIMSEKNIAEARLKKALCECGSNECELIDILYDDQTKLSDICAQEGITVAQYAQLLRLSQKPEKTR